MGELLRATEKNAGTRGKVQQGMRGTGADGTSAPVDDTPTLDDLGVSEKQSSRAQRLAEPRGGGELDRQ
ncbi:MAG: hypothetical protein HOP18_14805 [Deltaproteobacteria bacterium]|nr:hypothetical protein [Deltaproteobacteria bacterium]